MSLRNRLARLERHKAAQIPEHWQSWPDAQLERWLSDQTGIPVSELTDDVPEQIATQGAPSHDNAR